MATIGGSAINLNRTAPVISYTSLDALSLKADLTTYAQNTFSDRWTDFNPDQFAVVFLDLVAYIGDLLTFHLNAGLRETSVYSAQRRQHIVELAGSNDYTLGSASQATGQLTLTSDVGAIPYALESTSQFSVASGDVTFQPVQDETITTTTQIIDIIEGEEFVNIALLTSDGSREQFVALTTGPLIDGTLSVRVSAVTWTEVSSFTLSEAGDEHYKVKTDDAGETTIYFGDGVNGKIPPAVSSVTASWKTGGGKQGSVGANTIETVVSTIPGLLSITNAAATTPGGEAETLSQAREAIPGSLAAGDRAVIIEDYAVIAKASSTSVAMASAREAANRVVEVIIAPVGGGVASNTLKNSVGAYVSARRMIGRRVIMADPFYVDCEVDVDVYANDTVRSEVVQALVSDLFRTALSTDLQDAIFDFGNLGFEARDSTGEPQLTRQRVYDLLNKYKSQGVQSSKIARFTTKPKMKPKGYVNSSDYALTFTVDDADELLRRQYRVVFTTPTTYDVYEGIVGHSTSLTGQILTDNRAEFPALPTGANAPFVNPNTLQTTQFEVDESLATATAVQLLTAADNMFIAGNKGDSYRVEWAAFAPASGTVGVNYVPTKDGTVLHGFTWNIAGTAFAAGDEFLIDVFRNVDDIILAAGDEIPLLDIADLTVTVRSAF